MYKKISIQAGRYVNRAGQKEVRAGRKTVRAWCSTLRNMPRAGILSTVLDVPLGRVTAVEGRVCLVVRVRPGYPPGSCHGCGGTCVSCGLYTSWTSLWVASGLWQDVCVLWSVYVLDVPLGRVRAVEGRAAGGEHLGYGRLPSEERHRLHRARPAGHAAHAAAPEDDGSRRDRARLLGNVSGTAASLRRRNAYTLRTVRKSTEVSMLIKCHHSESQQTFIKAY